MKEHSEQILHNKNELNVVPITIALVLAGFFCMLSETVLNMALKNLMVEFSISATTVQWLSTGYMLIIGISIPISAFLIKTFTTRQLYIS